MNRFISFLLKGFSSTFDENADDVNLVESQSTEKNNTTDSATTKKTTASIWKTFANIIDRVLFVSLFLFYLFMIIDLLPENFFAKSPERTIEVIGY